MPDTRSSGSPTAPPSLVSRAGIPGGLLMLVGWGIWTFAFDPAPGWVHLFLTLGVFFVIWGIVARGTPTPPVKR